MLGTPTPPTPAPLVLPPEVVPPLVVLVDPPEEDELELP